LWLNDQVNDLSGIRKRWEETWRKLNARTVPQGVFDELVNAYSSAERFYHNLIHIEDCLSLFDQTASLVAHPEEVELAIWFHDAVYDTRRNDNEQRSAAWATSVIIQSGVGRSVAERVSTLILATRHTAEVTDTDAQLIVDVDLSILGRGSDFFWQYEENIRKEYAWVPENVYRQKRIEVLRGFLERPDIYYHEPYREMFEVNARANLLQAIERLSTL
jgi:predicted metal-dependent HD superfamily phosphohydrolase